jgi:hypothetical protein
MTHPGYALLVPLAGALPLQVGGGLATHTAPERLYPLLHASEHPGYAPIVPFAGALAAQENE